MLRFKLMCCSVSMCVPLFAGWNELLIALFAFRSTGLFRGVAAGAAPTSSVGGSETMEVSAAQPAVEERIELASDVAIARHTAHAAGVGTLFDRIGSELVAKLRSMRVDLLEIAALRAIILFNPGACHMSCCQHHY